MSIEGAFEQIIVEDQIKKKAVPHPLPISNDIYIMSYSDREDKWLKYV